MTGTFVTATGVDRKLLPWGALGWFSRPGPTGAKDLVAIVVVLTPGHGHSFHPHPEQEAVLDVIGGQVDQWLGRKRQMLGPSDAIFIEKNVVRASFDTLPRPAKFLAIPGPSVTPGGHVSVEVGGEEAWKCLR